MSAELPTLDVLSLLQRRQLITEAEVREVRAREGVQRARLLRAKVGGPIDRGPGYRVSAAQVIASFELKRADGGGVVTEDLIMQAIADDHGLPWRRLDPVELDLQVVTSKLSRPFAQRHGCLVLEALDGVLTVALAEPADRELLESLHQMTGKVVHPVVASKSDIERIIREFYGFRRTLQAAEKEYADDSPVHNLERMFRVKTDAELESTDKHVVAAADFILRTAMEQRASDIHVEPKRREALVRFRIDGILHLMHRLPRPVVPPLVSRLKTMSRMDIAERRKPQDGRIKMAHDDGREVEMRVSTMPTVFGEKVVIRLFDPDALLVDLDTLGFFPDQRRIWDGFLGRPHGILLLTGPTGSGKTTTLYSSLKALSSPEVNIVTIEDPIEMVTEQFNQVQVDPRVDVTFSSALRTVLRQDPDIIMVGEIRDLETARHAVQAALTGHLVFSTLHTNDAPSAFARLIDLGIEPFLASSTVAGVAAQRLVRKVCDHCAEHRALTEDEVNLLGISTPGHDALMVREGQGCVECRGTGHMGRSGVYEVMPVTHSLRRAIHHQADAGALMAQARREGMMTLHETALRKLATGVTSFSEVVRVTTAADET
jgi:general secretion pathway protein E